MNNENAKHNCQKKYFNFHNSKQLMKNLEPVLAHSTRIITSAVTASILFLGIYLIFASTPTIAFEEMSQVKMVSYGDLTITTTGYIDLNAVSTYLSSGNVITGSTSIDTDDSAGFLNGDEILILTMDGIRAGTFETATVTSIVANQLNVAPLENSYDSVDKIMIQKVPHYNTVTIASGGELIAPAWNGQTGGVIAFNAENLIIQSGGKISADYSGFPTSEGPGKGIALGSLIRGGTGAGHGGYGGGGTGRNVPPILIGGISYGNLYSPITLGSGGGNTTHGGSGGGVIYIRSSIVTIDGQISSLGKRGTKGSSTSGEAGGAGAGGSILIISEQVDGSGTIELTGGAYQHRNANGGQNGGAGSGGRVAIYANTNTFTGDINANPGAPGVYVSGAQPGTVYFHLNNSPNTNIDPIASTIEVEENLVSTNDSTLITVTLNTINGTPIANQPVSITVSGSDNTIDFGGSNTTNSNGIVTGTFTSTTAETKTLIVSSGFVRIVDIVEVTFEGSNPSATNSTFSVASNAKITADGTSIGTLQVTVLDQFGNSVSGSNAVSLSTLNTDVDITPVVTPSNASGFVTFNVTSSTPQTVTFEATVDGQLIPTTQSIAFVAADLDVQINGPIEVTRDLPIELDIVAGNAGFLAADNSEITFTLPQYLLNPTFSDSGSVIGSGPYIWNIGNLSALETQILTINGTIAANATVGQSVSVTASGETTSVDIFPENDSSQHDITILQEAPQLNISVSESVLYMAPGANETFTLRIHNSGNASAQGVLIDPFYAWFTPSFSENINAGETIEHVYTLTAPSEPGKYIARVSNNFSAEEIVVEINVGEFASIGAITVDNGNNTPVSNAQAKLTRSELINVYDNSLTFQSELFEYQGATSFDGEIDLSNFPTGAYTLEILAKANQYAAHTQPVTISPVTANISVSLATLPNLVFNPDPAHATVVAGNSAVLQVKVTNQGPGVANGVRLNATNGISLSQPWMSVALPNTPSMTLAPGESMPISIFLNPPLSAVANGTVADYPGSTIAITADNAPSATLALDVSVILADTGSLALDIKDDNANPLDNAKVTLISQALRTITLPDSTSYETNDWKEVYTDNNGQVSVDELAPGGYTIYVGKDGYYSHVGNVDVQAGPADRSLGINSESVNMQVDPFNYSWTVEETEILDTYDITVTVDVGSQNLVAALFASAETIFSEFEILTTEAPQQKTQGLSLVTEQTTNVDNTGEWLIVNMGVLPITDLTLEPRFEGVTFDVDTDAIVDTLAPGESMTVPFTVTTSANIETLPEKGVLTVDGSYQIKISLGANEFEFKWHTYRNTAPIYRKVENTNEWTWEYTPTTRTVTGHSGGGRFVPPAPNAPPPSTDQRAQLQLSGNAFLTRQALRAVLDLENVVADQIDFSIDINAVDSESGEDVMSGFAVTPTLPTPLTIPGGESASLNWLLVPGDFGIEDPAGEQVDLSAIITYTQANGNQGVTETYTDTVTIYPQPNVRLSYSHGQLNADNIFYIEVMADNEGYGVAKNLNLNLSNVNVLPDVDGDGVELGFVFDRGEIVEGDGNVGEYTFDFGDLGPEEKVTGRWYVEVYRLDGESFSLLNQPVVTGFSVECTHQDYQGLTLSSLIVNCGNESLNSLTHDCPYCSHSDRVDSAGNPINTFNGNHDFSQSTPPVRAIGAPLQFKWTYNSLNTGVNPDIPAANSRLGLGWSNNYELHLVFEDNGEIIFHSPRGNSYKFEPVRNGYRALAGVWADLDVTELAGEAVYTITARNQAQSIFNSNGQITKQIDPKGNETTYIYTVEGYLDRVTDVTTSRYLQFAYHADGRIASVTDTLMRSTEFGYDLNNDLNTITDTRGSVWTYTYETIDGGYRLLSDVIDPELRIVESTGHDDFGRGITQTFQGMVLEIDYFADGRRVITHGIGAEKRVETHVYNNEGLLVARADGDNELEYLVYDINQNRVNVEDRLGFATNYEKTEIGYTTAITDSLNNATRIEYDDNNNWSSISRSGRNTEYVYDEQTNTLTERINHFGDSVSYTYNQFGQEKTVTDETGVTTEYRYDEIGQLEVITNSLGLTQTFEYDEIGRVITTTDVTGKITVKQYDKANNVVEMTDNFHENGIPNYLNEYNIQVSYTYDGSGRQVSMTDNVGRTGYTVYDEYGRPYATIANYRNPNNVDPLILCQNTDERRNYNICSFSEYDSLGRMIETTDPLGRKSRTIYDNLGRVEALITNWNGNTALLSNPASCLALPNPQRDENMCTLFEYNELGQSTITTDSLGRKTRTFYDSTERIKGIVTNWQTGFTLDQCYDSSLSPTRDENICAQFGYDEVGNTIIMTDSLGIATRTFYDELNRVTATAANWNPATLQTQDQCVLSPSNIATENVCTVSTYNKLGQIKAVTNSLGQVSLTVYDSLNRPVVRVANWDGVTTIESEADCSFPPIKPDTNVCSATRYNALGRLESTVTPLGEVVSMTYDSLNRPLNTTRQLDGQPIVTTAHYNEVGGQAFAQDTKGNINTPVYDDVFRSIGNISHEGTQITQTLDILGRVVETTNNLGNTTVIEYDGLDRVVSQTDALQNITTFEYNLLGNQTAIINAEGVRTGFVYDDLRRLVTVIENETGAAQTDKSDIRTTYSYDVRGNMIGVVNGRGYTHTTIIYDALNRPIESIDALGHSTRTGYNAIGATTVMTDANGARTSYLYDGLNRPTEIYYEVDDETIEFEYNALGQRKVMTDNVGVTIYGYDEWQRLTSVDDVLGQRVEYTYDLLGNRETIIYPDGRKVTYGYDGDSRLRTVTDWDEEQTTYDYDPLGRLITTTLPTGVQAVNSYDRVNRLIGLSYTTADDSLLAEFSYKLDDVGNRVVVTETLNAPDVVGEIQAFLEENGKLVIEAESGSKASGSTHNWVDQTIQGSASDNNYVRAIPDLGERLDANATESPAVKFNINAGNAGNYTVWVRGMAPDLAGDSLHVSLDGQHLGELTGFAVQEWSWAKINMSTSSDVLATLDGTHALELRMREDGLRIDQLLLTNDITYTPQVTGEVASPIQTISETVTSGVTVISYSYDDLYRLTNATYSGSVEADYEYKYDSVGNMTMLTETVEANVVEAIRYFDDANRMIDVTDAISGTTSYVYDNNGNLTEVIPPNVNDQPPATKQVYRFNQRNLMTASDLVTNGTASPQATFVYDGSNNRLQQVDLSGATPMTTTYTNDVVGLSQVLAANDGSGTTYNIFGFDLLSQQVASAAELAEDKLYPLADGLGSIRLELVGDAVESTRTYDPYGALLVETGTRGTFYGYTGEQEGSTGLLYLRARYYNPNTKTFMGKDSISGSARKPHSMNGWSYVEGNPINLVDPTGQVSEFPDYCKEHSDVVNYITCVTNDLYVEPHWRKNALYVLTGGSGDEDYDEVLANIDKDGSGCFSGPVPYRLGGYSEGISLNSIVHPRKILEQLPNWLKNAPEGYIPATEKSFVQEGDEIVYDFASMHKADFKYSGRALTDSIGIAFAYTSSQIYGLYSWRSIEENYGGAVITISGGFGVNYKGDLGVALGGLKSYNPWDRSIYSEGIYVTPALFGVSLDLYPIGELSVGGAHYEMVTGSNEKINTSNIDNIRTGAGSPWAGSELIPNIQSLSNQNIGQWVGSLGITRQGAFAIANHGLNVHQAMGR